eukprot:7258326-Alexandrium_andersonii.AAC.1
MGQAALSGRRATAATDRLQASNQTTVWCAASGPGATTAHRPARSRRHPPPLMPPSPSQDPTKARKKHTTGQTCE